MRQQRNEGLRRKFGEKANIVGPWIERQMDAVAAIGMGMQGTLEDQLQRLRQHEQQAVQYKPQMDELEKIHQEVQESLIFENRYTQYTMEVSFPYLFSNGSLKFCYPDTASWMGAVTDVSSPKPK